MLSELMVDKAFMGTNSFSLKRGATSPDINQADIRKAMIAISNKVILLCDSSKIGKNSFVQFAALDQIDTLVTDHMLPDDQKKLEESGVEVIIADLGTVEFANSNW